MAFSSGPPAAALLMAALLALPGTALAQGKDGSPEELAFGQTLVASMDFEVVGTLTN